MNPIDLDLDFDAIRDRIDKEKQAYKPSEWAKKIGVSKNTVSNIHGTTKQKPSFKYILAVSLATGKPIEYFLWGHGKKRGGQVRGSVKSFGREEGNNHIEQLFDKSHNEIISLFDDKKWAREINRKLVEIERSDPDKKEVISAFIEGVRIGLIKPKKKQETGGSISKKDAPSQNLADAGASIKNEKT